jgi:hypothetical protein
VKLWGKWYKILSKEICVLIILNKKKKLYRK